MSASATTNEFDEHYRAGFGFDTSSIGSDVVDSATLSFQGDNRFTGLGDTDIDVTSFTPADESDFANADYNVASYGSTRLASGTAISTWNISGSYNDFTLNSSGEAHINKLGNTFFGLRNKWDVYNKFTLPFSNTS